MSGISLPHIPALRFPATYLDTHGKQKPFKLDESEVFRDATEFLPAALAARTPDGNWLLGIVTGIREPIDDKLPLWNQFDARWREVGIIEAADWFKSVGLNWPPSLEGDIEKQRRLAELARQLISPPAITPEPASKPEAPARWSVGLSEQQKAAVLESFHAIIADSFAGIRLYFRTYHGAREPDFTGDDPLFYDTLKVELGIGRAAARDREMSLGEIGYLLQLVHRIRSAPTEPARLIVLEEVRRVYDESVRTGSTEMSAPLGFLLRRHSPAIARKGDGEPDAGLAAADDAPLSGLAFLEQLRAALSSVHQRGCEIRKCRAVPGWTDHFADVAFREELGQLRTIHQTKWKGGLRGGIEMINVVMSVGNLAAATAGDDYDSYCARQKLSQPESLEAIETWLEKLDNVCELNEPSLGNQAHPPEAPPPEAPHDWPDLITLDQAAGMVHKSKRTLEYHKTKGKLPAPVKEGGGGKAALYDWKTMRAWLIQEFGTPLPEKFPRFRGS